MACVLRWRELSRNKSRDEREMWPNRTAHTDIPWIGKERGGGAIAAGLLFLSLCSYCPSAVPRREFSSNNAIASAALRPVYR